jgi:hypothetical protein
VCVGDYCQECDEHRDNCSCNNEPAIDFDEVLDYSTDVHAVLGVSIPGARRFDLPVGVEYEMEHADIGAARRYARACYDAGVGVVCHDGSLASSGGELKMRAVLHSGFAALLAATPKPVATAWDNGRCGIHVNVGLPDDVRHGDVKAILHGLTTCDAARALLIEFGRRDNAQYAAVGRGGRRGDKYLGINTGKRARVEFRIFRSTLRRECVQQYVDFAHAVTLWACSLAADLRAANPDVYDTEFEACDSARVASLADWLHAFSSPAVAAVAVRWCSIDYLNNIQKKVV